MCRVEERSLDLIPLSHTLQVWFCGPWAMGGHFAPFSGVRRRHAFYIVLESAMSNVLWVMINIYNFKLGFATRGNYSYLPRIPPAVQANNKNHETLTSALFEYSTLHQIMYLTQLTLESRQDETQSLAHWWWVPRSLEENPEWLNTVLPCKSL